jgi:hypothetical protein
MYILANVLLSYVNIYIYIYIYTHIYQNKIQAKHIKMISLFKIIYAFVEDRIILGRSWSETRERIAGYAKEDPIFKLGEKITKTVGGSDKSMRKNNDS